MLSVILEPEELGKLIRRPLGSAEAGLDGLLPLIHVYRYLEGSDCWNVLGKDVRENSSKLKRRIKEGKAHSVCLSVPLLLGFYLLGLYIVERSSPPHAKRE